LKKKNPASSDTSKHRTIKHNEQSDKVATGKTADNTKKYNVHYAN